MGAFLALYGGDILVGALILAGAAWAIRGMVKNRKAGKPACGGCDGDCAHCTAHRV